MAHKSFFAEIWTGHGGVRPFLIHFVSDLIKTVCLLAGLWLFWETISFLRFRHYPEEYLSILEKIHFVATVCILTVTSITFVVSQVAAWFKLKNSQSAA